MRKVRPIQGERHVELQWCGPFLLKRGKLLEHPAEAAKLPEDGPGLYLAIGDHPLQGPGSLLYIGKTDRILRVRINEHAWLLEEWRLEIFVAIVPDTALLDEIEGLLIYAHMPAANASRISEPPPLRTPLRIWNVGRFWRLYPEVSSAHDWYQPYGRSRRSTTSDGPAARRKDLETARRRR